MTSQSCRSLLALTDLAPDELLSILDRADELKLAWDSSAMPSSLSGQRIGIWSYGNGFRNRVAFELGASALGAQVVSVPGELGLHEPLEDIGHYLRNWLTMLVVRCRRHSDLAALTRDVGIPVVNARTDHNHPCEIAGDLQFVRRQHASLDGLTVLFVGEATNLLRSWLEAAQLLAINVTQLGPPGSLLSSADVDEVNRSGAGRVRTTSELSSIALGDVDVLYTDCWPKGADARTRATFEPYRITRDIVDAIAGNGLFLPCPPVTRGEELTAESLASPKCRVYEAKEYLLHAQNAILEFLATRS